MDLPPPSLHCTKPIPSARILRSIHILDSTPSLDKTPERGQLPVENTDLVKILIEANPGPWNKLLRNEFCKAMGTTPVTDAKFLEGFKSYMIDCKYLFNQIRYHGFRLANSPDDELFKEADHVQSATVYVTNFAKDTCGGPELQIPLKDIICAHEDNACSEYSEWESYIAKNEDWVAAQVVMVPCIQGYYKIANALEDDPGSIKDTPWYRTWVGPNLDESYPTKQINIFKDMGIDWLDPMNKDKTKRYSDIFVRACEHEIAFFKIGDRVDA